MEEKFLNAFKEAMEIEDKEVKLGDKFRDYEGWSSLKELSVLAMMDSDFGINLEMKDFNKLITVGDLYNYLNSNSK
jgi:acyl carrier protein